LTAAPPPLTQVPDHVLLVGLGLANRAVAAALAGRGHRVTATDDRPGPDVRAAARALGITLVEAPDEAALDRLVADVGLVVASPGLPDRHPVFALAARHRVPAATELDLAAVWDRRPIVAVTGTNGKTTVTTMVTEMLREGGIRCLDAGNNDLPLVTAIDDPEPEWFVVEASSFRLGRTHGWAPRVGTWLNLAPDHLDVHTTHEDYEAAKARIWAAQGPDDVAVGNVDDTVVARRLRQARARQVSWSASGAPADYHVADGVLRTIDGELIAVADLPRGLRHDVDNALAAAATAEAAGCPREAVVAVLRRFGPLPHRVAPVATVAGVTYYDDSKATVPHATLAAVRGFDSVVLIAGGRNKGLDLGAIAEGADHVRAVVAIGDAAPEVVAAFDGLRPVEVAGSMADAVAAAARLARPGDAVLLSPACASFDWYPNYAARGDDFAAAVHTLQETT
jgi:UDP-N-acetylmuramoylalanine--D-glutamate ligase